jgi:subtilase family serine protease
VIGLERLAQPGRHARPSPALAAAVTLALTCGAIAMADKPDPTRPTAGVARDATRDAASPAPSEFVEVGPTPRRRTIRFELELAFPGRDAMQAYALAVGDPSSPDYRRFLTADEIGRRFGLDDADVARVESWAAEHGLTVAAVSPQRIAIEVRAPARAVEAALGVTLRDYADATGRRYHAPADPPAIPPALDGLVTAIAGLDARPTERPAVRGPVAAGPVNGLTPPIIDRAYELEGLRAMGLHGEGQTVAIVSLDTFDPDDVARFERLAGVSGPRVERVAVNGGVSRPGDDQVEVNLDIDVIRAIAPKATIIDYEAPNRGGSIGALVDRIVADGRAAVVSISWGSCELTRSAEGLSRMARSMAAAASAGITVFAASGDHGAYGCIDQDREDLRIAVDSPASDVNVIAVGGTYASMLEDGTYVGEVAWEEPLTGWGPGGGVSTVYRRPAWQAGTGVDNARSNGMRQVPDVAGPADPDSGFLTVSGGEASAGGGTSAATPFWAGFTLLVRQLAEREGVAGLGALGPLLYGVAASQPAGALFHDVIRGGNLYDNAGAGWDYATGLGTPRGTPLARAIVDAVKGVD